MKTTPVANATSSRVTRRDRKQAMAKLGTRVRGHAPIKAPNSRDRRFLTQEVLNKSPAQIKAPPAPPSSPVPFMPYAALPQAFPRIQTPLAPPLSEAEERMQGAESATPGSTGMSQAHGLARVKHGIEYAQFPVQRQSVMLSSGNDPQGITDLHTHAQLLPVPHQDATENLTADMVKMMAHEVQALTPTGLVQHPGMYKSGAPSPMFDTRQAPEAAPAGLIERATDFVQDRPLMALAIAAAAIYALSK